MDFQKFGKIGVGVAGIGVAAEWFTFLNGKTMAVVLSAFVAVIGILITLTAALKEGWS